MADTTIDLLKNSSYVGKMDELIAAVKLGSGATSDVEWDNVKNKPTTIGGYGITDAKIDNGTITLGNQTITPLTSAPVTSVNSKTGAVTLSATDVSAIPSTLTGTAGQVLTKTADGQEWKDVDIPTQLPNPNALTFTGAVTGSYDGSAPLSVEIPSGGGETWETIAEIPLEQDTISYILTSISGWRKIKLLIRKVYNNTGSGNCWLGIYTGNMINVRVMVDSSVIKAQNADIFADVADYFCMELRYGNNILTAGAVLRTAQLDIGSGTTEESVLRLDVDASYTAAFDGTGTITVMGVHA